MGSREVARRGRFVALLGVALVLTGCASIAKGIGESSGRALCRPIDYSRMIRTTANTPIEYGVLRVPVAVHIMDRHGENKVLTYWTVPRDPAMPDYLTKFFDAEGASSVNKVWAPAGIRFDVEEVHHCLYSRDLPIADGEGKLFLPDPQFLRGSAATQQQAIVDRYLEINQIYGVPRKLNIYLWWHLEGGWAYGESPRRARIEVTERRIEALSTVWYFSQLQCDTPRQAKGCQKIFAHELGHALGLTHICRDCQLCAPCRALQWEPRDYYTSAPQCRPGDLCLPAEAGDCCREPEEAIVDGRNVCGEPYACCNSQTSSAIMFPNAGAVLGDGVLCDAEVLSARAAAKEFFPDRAGGTDGKRSRSSER